MRIVDYKTDRHCKYNIRIHVVWTPKYRRAVLINGVETRLEQIIRDAAKEKGVDILALNIMPDHVHLLINVPPSVGLHKIVKLMKGRSSRLLREEFPFLKSKLPTLWTHSYFASSVGTGQEKAIFEYIEMQKA